MKATRSSAKKVTVLLIASEKRAAEGPRRRSVEIGTIRHREDDVFAISRWSLRPVSVLQATENKRIGWFRKDWSSRCKRGGKLTTMKKPTPTQSHESPAHPNLINYLALIHAVAHPGTRPDPGKHHRSSKMAATAAG